MTSIKEEHINYSIFKGYLPLKGKAGIQMKVTNEPHSELYIESGTQYLTVPRTHLKMFVTILAEIEEKVNGSNV